MVWLYIISLLKKFVRNPIAIIACSLLCWLVWFWINSASHIFHPSNHLMARTASVAGLHSVYFSCNVFSQLLFIFSWQADPPLLAGVLYIVLSHTEIPESCSTSQEPKRLFIAGNYSSISWHCILFYKGQDREEGGGMSRQFAQFKCNRAHHFAETTQFSRQCTGK